MQNSFPLFYLLYIKEISHLALLLQSTERLKGEVPGKSLGNKTRGEELPSFFLHVYFPKNKEVFEKVKATENPSVKVINDIAS